MKTILIPTDFSECAQNAADFAVDLHRDVEARYVLFNTFSASDPECDDACFADLKKESKTKLEAEQKRLSKMIDYGRVECVSMEGVLFKVNKEILDRIKPDLVVFGTEGVDEEDMYVSHSNAGELARKIDRDMIIVPEGAKFRNYQNVLFTTDYKNIPNKGILDPFLQVVADSEAKPHILHILDAEEVLTVEQEREKSVLLDGMNGIDHEFAEKEAEKVDEGIESYINDNRIDLVTVVPRHQSFTDKIYHYSITQKVAEKLSVPILVISLKQHTS